VEFKSAIEAYHPANIQELQDKRVIINNINHFGKSVLLRENEIVHITSSGFVMNHTLDKV